MAQVVVRGPLDKFKLSDQPRFQPSALLHFFRGQALAPAAGVLLWKVGEGARLDFEFRKTLKDLRPEQGRKTVSRSRRVQQSSFLEVSNHQGIKTSGTRGVASNDEFLALVDPHLLPSP